MKSRFLVALLVIAIAVCMCMTACTKENPPDNEKPNEPKYVTLTLDEFKANAEEFTQITNYLSATGYKLDLNVEGEIDNVKSEQNLSAILNMQDTTDVQLSVNFTSTNGGNIPGVAGGTVELPQNINVYVFDHTLYADVEIEYLVSMTLKDSMPVDNDLTSIINNVINGNISLPGVDNVPTIDVEDMIDYFDDYLVITYCEELGHYVLELNYTGGTYDGEQIDPFACKVEIYVSSARITSVTLKFDSAEIKASGTLTESTEAIKRPSDTSSYENGMLFDFLEGIFSGSSDIPSTDDPTENPELPNLDDILGMLPEGLLDSIISGMLSGELQGDLQSLLEAYPGLSELFEAYPELEEFFNALFSGGLFFHLPAEVDLSHLTPEERKMIEDYFDKLDLEAIAYSRLLSKLEEYLLPGGGHNIMD